MKNYLKQRIINTIMGIPESDPAILSEKDILKIELREVTLALDDAYGILANVTEPELIDSAIYQLNSIQSKYTYLSRKYREFTA